MSCGEAHETSCAEVLAEVYLFLDSECDEVRRDRIRRHLDECGSCLQQFGVEQELKALVARCCQETAPVGLRERLRVRLRTVAVTEEVTLTEPPARESAQGTAQEPA